MSERSLLNLGVKCKGSSVFSRKKFIGSDFYIVPVSMIVAGAYFPDVSNKEGGTAIYFDAEEIKKSLGTWDGKPAALNHPPSGQSLTKSDIFNNHWLGFVFASRYEEDKKRLTSELWLQESRSKEIMAKLQSGEEIDVSIGAFADVVATEGESNGVQYKYKVTNMTGDHLAILPGSKGACGWEDGCGIRAEENLEEVFDKDREELKNLVANMDKEVKEAAQDEVNNNLGKQSNNGVSAMSEPCVEKKLKIEKITVEEIMANSDMYCKKVIDALVMAKSERDELIETLAASEVNGVSLDREFLLEASTKHLKDLKGIIDYKLEASRVVAKDEKKEEKVDFSLGAGTVSKEELTCMPPKVIDWS